MEEMFWIYLLVINVVAMIVYYIDKQLARHQHSRNATRIPESVLMLLAIIGGSLGARMAMSFFRHKTNHPTFTVGVTLLLFLHIIIIGVCWTLNIGFFK